MNMEPTFVRFDENKPIEFLFAACKKNLNSWFYISKELYERVSRAKGWYKANGDGVIKIKDSTYRTILIIRNFEDGAYWTQVLMINCSNPYNSKLVGNPTEIFFFTEENRAGL